MISSIETRTRCDAASHGMANTRARTSSNSMIGAEHADAGAELGSAKGDHVLPDVSSNDLAVLRVGMGQDVLDEVVAILVAGDIDQRDAGTVVSTLADAIQIATQELGTSDLEALLNNL